MSRNANPGHFAPGKSGNPTGRPAGARNRATVAVEALFDGEVEEISRKAIELAKLGDLVAIRIILDRVVPVRKDRPIRFTLPPIETTSDLTKATASLLAAVADGELSPAEASEIGRLVDGHIRAIEATELAGRLDRLEAAAAKGTNR